MADREPNFMLSGRPIGSAEIVGTPSELAGYVDNRLRIRFPDRATKIDAVIEALREGDVSNARFLLSVLDLDLSPIPAAPTTPIDYRPPVVGTWLTATIDLLALEHGPDLLRAVAKATEEDDRG